MAISKWQRGDTQRHPKSPSAANRNAWYLTISLHVIWRVLICWRIRHPRLLRLVHDVVGVFVNASRFQVIRQLTCKRSRLVTESVYIYLHFVQGREGLLPKPKTNQRKPISIKSNQSKDSSVKTKPNPTTAMDTIK